MLNSTLVPADFNKMLSKDEQGGFLGKKATVVTLRKNCRLWKLSSFKVENSKRTGYLSPWWAVVLPEFDDKLGAVGRYNEAKANQVTMQAMTRFAAAIRVDWNEIAEYQEVELVDEAKAFWGQFEPQPSSSLPEVGMGAIFDHHGLTANFGKGLKPAERAADRKSAEEAYERIKTIAAKRKKVQDYVPDILGGIDAWQLYIPNLKEEHVVVKPSIPSNDMAALAVHFSFSPK